jgi:protease-4
MHLGEMLKRFGIGAEFVTTGAYKSSPEFFTRSGPSPASRLMQDALLDDLYGEVTGHIAKGRNKTTKQMNEIIDNAPYTAQFARKAGLVDAVQHYDQLEAVLRKIHGPRTRFQSASKILDHRDSRWGSRPAIGVLYATGTITDGKSVDNPFLGTLTIGSETFARAAEELRLDENVRAVVLRVESPGGSITAADVMWRSLERLAATKPLVVSMGDVAASGGYYIAAPGHVIFASPETITGSIGVFTGKFDLSEFYSGLGIHKELYLRGARSAILSDAHAWSDDERQTVQKNMNALYDLFLQRVATGRKNLNKAAVAPLAGGRVWTGNQALQCGLVDRHAGLLEAIDTAANLGAVDPHDLRFEIRPTPRGWGGMPSSPLGQLAELMAGADLRALLQHALPSLKVLAKIPVLLFPGGTPLALMPWQFEH